MTQSKNKSSVASDTWLTPLSYYERLNTRFNFDGFDPCPANAEALGFDGLEVPWANRTFCNPPYSRALKESFIRKAYEESSNGKVIVMLLPVSTSSVAFHKFIAPHARVEFIQGRLYFEGVDNYGTWVNPLMGLNSHRLVVPDRNKTVSRAGQNDSMLVIFDVCGTIRSPLGDNRSFRPYAPNII